jgi:hypothetical protein
MEKILTLKEYKDEYQATCPSYIDINAAYAAYVQGCMVGWMNMQSMLLAEIVALLSILTYTDKGSA